jgi:hypothetical protein
MTNVNCHMPNVQHACRSKAMQAKQCLGQRITNYMVIHNRGRAGFILENFPFSHVFTLHILSTCWEIIGFYIFSHVFGKEIMAVEPPTQLTG